MKVYARAHLPAARRTDGRDRSPLGPPPPGSVIQRGSRAWYWLAGMPGEAHVEVPPSMGSARLHLVSVVEQEWTTNEVCLSLRNQLERNSEAQMSLLRSSPT